MTEESKRFAKVLDQYKYCTITSDYAKKIINNYLNKALAQRPISSRKIDFLDVASGPGTVTMELIEQFGDKANYVATDIVAPMLEMLETKVRSSKVPVTTKVLDGQNMNEIADSSVDFLYCLFGVIFFPDRSKGFSEFFRVLRPGGSAFVTSWSNSGPIEIGYAFARRFGKEEEARKKVSGPMALSDKNLFEKEMREAGFVDIVIDTVEIDTSVSREGMILIMTLNPISSLFEPEEASVKCSEFLDDCYGKEVDTIPLKFVAHVAVAKKPGL